jgi:hypothetical protein
MHEFPDGSGSVFFDLVSGESIGMALSREQLMKLLSSDQSFEQLDEGTRALVGSLLVDS